MRAPFAILALCLSLAAQADGIYIDDSGSVRKAQRIYIDDAGTVREIQRIYVDDGGTIRLVFQNAVVSISDQNVQRIVVDPADATASYALESDGDIATNLVDSGDWITPKAAAGADYECRATVVSGTFTSGTFGSWLALSSTRSWTLVRTTLGTSTASMLIEIRRASDGTVLDSATISFTATVES
jgi:hypothetical protein